MNSKIEILSRIKEIYNNGENIISFLKKINKQKNNCIEDILISYDFQAGSYIKFANENVDFINRYTSLISEEIKQLDVEINTILEVGVGEATTLASLIQNLNLNNINFFGFDISWSRVFYGKQHLKEKKINNVKLFTADLFSIPFDDNSIDVVYTSHSLEPNGGREIEALKELFRVTNKYLILLEPAYEFADDESKKRMEFHGYVKNLVHYSNELGFNVIENRLFELSSNYLNPTQIIIIEKNINKKTNINFYCPITKTVLKSGDGYYFTTEGLLTYPIIKNIPCFLPQNAIVTTHLNDF